MTDFTEWYAKKYPDLDPLKNSFRREQLRQAYEAGAASQDGTLRDKFAGQALAGLCARDLEMKSLKDYAALHAYEFADAMLEARKVTGEGK
jgi:hypothetical protein